MDIIPEELHLMIYDYLDVNYLKYMSLVSNKCRRIALDRTLSLNACLQRDVDLRNILDLSRKVPYIPSEIMKDRTLIAFSMLSPYCDVYPFFYKNEDREIMSFKYCDISEKIRAYWNANGIKTPYNRSGYYLLTYISHKIITTWRRRYSELLMNSVRYDENEIKGWIALFSDKLEESKKIISINYQIRDYLEYHRL